MSYTQLIITLKTMELGKLTAGMSTDKWREIPPKRIYLDNLEFTQPHLATEALIHPPEQSYSGDEYPHIVEHEGKLYVEDGHHRLARHIVRGRKTARVRVYKALIEALKGGPTSGNWGHAGRPGKRGGSAPKTGSGAAMSLRTGRDWQQRQAAKRPGDFPNDPDTVRYVKSLGGSTGAELVEANGKRYVRKRGNSAEHLYEEAMADAAYRAAGIDVPKSRVYETPDGPVKLAEFIEGKTLDRVFDEGGPQAEAARVAAQKGFAADALLGNRDSVGTAFDNILIDNSGKAWRIDNGGSMRYRAQGALKKDWNDQPNEFNTMRNPSINHQTAKVFGDIDNGTLKSQVRDLVKRRSAISAALPPELRDTVNRRLNNLQEMASGL